MSLDPAALRQRQAAVRLLACDVDGVLTDGTLYYGERGEALKAFHVRDGLGLRLLRERGVELAVISARTSPALERRLADLRIRHYLPGREDKWAALAGLLGELGIAAAEAGFAGDDLLDLPAMRQVGLAIAVADAHPRVRAEAHWVTAAAGGRGAVREIADALLDARGELTAAEAALLGQPAPGQR